MNDRTLVIKRSSKDKWEVTEYLREGAWKNARWLGATVQLNRADICRLYRKAAIAARGKEQG